MVISLLDQIMIWGGIIVIALIGVYFSKFSKSMDGFFVAGRKMTYPLVLASMLASWHGISFYLWLPGAVYEMGWGGWVVTCGSYCIVDMFMGYFFAYKARLIGQFTVPDLFGKAYGHRAQVISGFAYFIYMGAFASAEIVACALVLNFAFGLSMSIGLVLSAIFVTVYCFTAGQYAVFMTDFIQYILMALGLAILCIFSFKYCMVGGNEALLAKLSEVWSEDKFSPTSDYNLTQIIGFSIIGMEAIMSQLYFSRAYSAKSGKIARDGILSSLYAMISHDWMLVVIGISSVVILGTAGISNAEQATLYLSATILPEGFLGIVLSALVAAGLSTINSALIAGASNLGRDVYQKAINPKANQKQIVNVGRAGIVILSIITVIIGMFAESLIMLVYTIGQLAMPIFIIPILAIYFYKKPKSLYAAYLSMGVGAIASIIWLASGEPDLIIPMPAGLFGLIFSAIGFFIGNCFGEKMPDLWEQLKKGEITME